MIIVNPDRIGAQLLLLRISAGLTQYDVADASGHRQGRISPIETGQQQPTLRTLVDILATTDHRLEIHRCPTPTPTIPTSENASASPLPSEPPKTP